MLLITNSAGKRFAVTVIRKGDRYGRDFGIVNDETDRIMGGKGETMVEFWDLSYPHGPVRPESEILGQFTGGRYFARTLREGLAGLSLDGGVSEWSIDAPTMAEVRGWLAGVQARETVWA